MIPDKESDIKPRFHKSRTHSNQKHEDDEVGIIELDDCLFMTIHFFWFDINVNIYPILLYSY